MANPAGLDGATASQLRGTLDAARLLARQGRFPATAELAAVLAASPVDRPLRISARPAQGTLSLISSGERLILTARALNGKLYRLSAAVRGRIELHPFPLVTVKLIVNRGRSSRDKE